MPRLGEGLRKLDPEGLGEIPTKVALKVQAHKVVPFHPEFKADMPWGGGASPEAGKIPLALANRNPTNRRRVFKVGRPAMRQEAIDRGGGKLLPEDQGTSWVLWPGFNVGRQQRPSHGTHCKEKTPKCLRCGEMKRRLPQM